MNDDANCKTREKQREKETEVEVQYGEKKASASTTLQSIEAINTTVKYIDQEHLSHLPFEVSLNAAGAL